MNKVILTQARLGAKPEVRTTESGLSVASLSVAITESWPDKSNPGKFKENTEWFRLVSFGGRAEYVAKLNKGDEVEVEGSLRNTKWTDSEGVEKYGTEILLSSIKRTRKGKESKEQDEGGVQKNRSTDQIPESSDAIPDNF